MIFTALVSPLALTFSSKRGSEDEQVPVYDEAVRLCDNARKRQTTAINKSIKLMGDAIDNDRNAIVYVDEDQDLTFELSGLIANKVLSDYNKPVVLLRHYTAKGVDQYRGSVRGKAAEGLTNLRELMTGLSGVEMAEGHAFAFGIGIDSNSLPEFKAHFDEALSHIDFNVNLYLVDAISRYNLVNKEIAEIFAKDDVWGHGVDKPMAVLTDVPTDHATFMGNENQHIKIDCGKYDVVMFNVPDLAASIENGTNYNLDIVGEFDVDKAYNIGRLQFVVKDYDTKDYVKQNIWDMAF